MSMGRDKLFQNYLKLASSYELLQQKEKRLLFIISSLRLLCFFGGFWLIWLGFNKNILAGFIAVVGSLSIFCYLLYSFSKHSRKREFYKNLVIINNNEAAAISGDISVFESGTCYTNHSHDFSNDIDLFGQSSLFQYLNRTCTGMGSDILAGWLSDPLKLSNQHKLRQEAIKELSESNSWYQEFIALGMMTPLRKSDIEGLLSWLAEKDDFSPGVFKSITLYLLPAITVTSLLLLATGLMNYQIFTSLFILNLLVVGTRLKKTGRIHNSVSGQYRYLSTTILLMKVFEGKSFSSVLLSEMKNGLAGHSHSAINSISKLSRILQSFDSRLNMLVGFILNGLLLWDFQCVYALQKWKKQTRIALPGWLNTIGQVDALISLGNYSFNNQLYIYPEKSENDIVFEAVSMGHPLISEDKRVCNDFLISEKGTIIVITGANMAGKSTFLRTVAVNYILAMAGAPVCALSFNFKSMHLFSSMRTIDSLSQNESYFYAELKRLRTLKTRMEEKDNVFFLLDEILKGTNSTDKSIGSKQFLKMILSLKGTGIIATHDLSLGDLEKSFPGRVFNKCFEIDIEGESVSFDYKLRDGVTQKMNAALLMRQMGITEDEI